MNLNYSHFRTWLLLLFFAMPALAFSQRVNFTVKGTVTAGGGEPLIGVTVQLPALSIGTITDVDGSYELTGNANPGDYNIEFRYVGYATSSQRVNISGSGAVTADVVLAEDILNMDEILIVGSSVTSKRKQLGNAINSLKADKLGTANPQGVTGITQNSGDPAGGFSVQLRGASTLLGSSEPLYVIDGVVISNNTSNVTNINATGGESRPGTNRLADINPNDIEDITVINGAAAAAQYGSRASNGVVLITTKKGTSGTPSFTYTSGFNINQLR